MSRCALCKTNLKDDETNVCDRCRLDFLEFKQQLAKKDKEIEELHKILDSQKRHIDIIEQPFRGRGTKRTGNVILDFELSIRKQVCDELRNKVLVSNGMISNMDELLNFRKILDQMEQAKVN